jgi:hypothetical protein
MIERCLLILLSIALVGSLGGFFLYVPILPTLAVTVILGGLCAMFWLGVCVGMRPRHAPVSEDRTSEKPSVKFVVDNFAADHGQHRRQALDCLVWHLCGIEEIVTEHHDIAELTVFD